MASLSILWTKCFSMCGVNGHDRRRIASAVRCAGNHAADRYHRARAGGVMKLSYCSDKYLSMAFDMFEHSGSDKVWLVEDCSSCFVEYPDFLKSKFGTAYKFTKKEVVAEHCKRAFKSEHDLSDEEFLTDHWQTLFAIQYPEARS